MSFLSKLLFKKAKLEKIVNETKPNINKPKPTLDSYVVVDVETTGLNPIRNDIIEFGAVKVIDNEITEVFSELVKPKDTLRADITRLTGITADMLAFAPSINRILPKFLEFIEANPKWDVVCKDDGVHNFVVQERTIKDEYEIECTKEAARVGDLIIDKIEEKIRSGEIKTEMDVSLLIEKELRLNGCERTGFDTLAAGPARSWAIHAFPGYTNGEWPGNGLSILDFGVVYNGYTSDTTLAVAKGELSPEQEKLLELVQHAADECLRLYKKDVPVKDACELAEKIFAKENRKMPHTLGHGIGLEIHEFPRVSTKMTADVTFQPGMIVTLEPGLYDEKLGGVRLENDVLITADGNEVITHSRIIRL